MLTQHQTQLALVSYIGLFGSIKHSDYISLSLPRFTFKCEGPNNLQLLSYRCACLRLITGVMLQVLYIYLVTLPNLLSVGPGRVSPLAVVGLAVAR